MTRKGERDSCLRGNDGGYAAPAIRYTLAPSDSLLGRAVNSPPEPLISVLLPTYNERENVAALAPAILDVLRSAPCEVIVVDDASPDGTAAAVRRMAAADPRVRLVERSGKRGLAGAVFAGAREARGRFVAVMDADRSHDPEELPDMLARAADGYDVVIGSRYVEGSAFLGQPFLRRLISRLLNAAARTLLLLPYNDVLTGYAVCRRELLAEPRTRYSSPGFKWLLELLSTRRGLSVYEWPIVFHDRQAGFSKASALEALRLGALCVRLAAWRCLHRG